MTSADIRQQFISFFENKGHKIVPSAPVVPHGDPTLMFTNAGMNQFKDVFLGHGSRDYSRAVDTQKCIRVSGKHNDLEEVGVDNYHHTFFEMLGNWSFGDYYKEEAISYAWELLVDNWKLDKTRLFATVYKTDDESYDYWKKYLPEDRILRFGDEDNFWEMGETGPCGPSSEIHYDGTTDKSGRELVNTGNPEVIEIWNLVFIEFNRQEDGTLEQLKSKHVDTGMGFERIVRVLQDKLSNYDTDVFTPILAEIERHTGVKYTAGEDQKDIAFRVVADHIRTLAFSIADGALPGSDGRGYVLRRILRRASRFASKLGAAEPLLYKLVDVLSTSMGDVFPELKENKKTIEKIIKGEEASFLQTLEKGIERFDEITNGKNLIKGSDIFLLYDTYGFPPDLTVLMAKEKGVDADIDGFEHYMDEQKKRSRFARKNKSIVADELNLDFTTEFSGYQRTEDTGKVLWYEENKIVLDKTPFYAEKGGQVSDTGYIDSNGSRYGVVAASQYQNAVILELERKFEGQVGDQLLQRVDITRRDDIKRNHSATHLLHAALNKVLGTHIKQQGSLVGPEYLRFDYNHFEKPSQLELTQIEEMVNSQIYISTKVDTRILSLEEARADKSIKQFFGEKYGAEVRAVSMGTLNEGLSFSSELCGGTHVSITSEIGLFVILSESSVSAGVRRIEAVTGRKAYQQYISLKESEEKLNNLVREKDRSIKSLEKQLQVQATGDMAQGLDAELSKAKLINGAKILVLDLKNMSMEQMRELGDSVRNKIGKKGIGLLVSVSDHKVSLVCVVSDDLKAEAPAGKLVGDAAKLVGGGGGGKPHMATAGGRQPDKLPHLVEQGFYNIVEKYLV